MILNNKGMHGADKIRLLGEQTLKESGHACGNDCKANAEGLSVFVA
jgi:hypothetical protein